MVLPEVLEVINRQVVIIVYSKLDWQSLHGLAEWNFDGKYPNIFCIFTKRNNYEYSGHSIKR